MATDLRYNATGEIARLMGDAKLARPTPVRGRDGRWSRDPGGEFDWFYALELSEREYISAKHMGGHLGPDELADLAGTDIDSAMDAWLSVVRIARSRCVDPLEDDYYASESDAVSLADIVGPQEIARLLSVQVNTIHQWVKRGVLPFAERVISGVPLWSSSTIVEWAERTNRL